MSLTPAYDALTTERRLEIEQGLYRKVFGRPFTERTIPDNPNDRQREYRISCVRDAILLGNNGSILSAGDVDAARELTARQGKGIAEIVDPSGFRQQAIEFMERLCAEGRPPFDLVRETERARHQLASGKLAMNAYGREKEIPRRQISQKHLKRLGYGPAGASGSAGVASFEKRSVEGTIFSCDFDFGTWRSTVMASFGYSQRNLRLRFPLRYDLSGADSAIITGDLLDRTMANVAFVLGELEAFLDRKE